MSFSAIQWAFRQKCRNATQQMILTALANYADDQGVCWPSKNTLADVCRLSKTAVCSNLNVLKDDGYLTVEVRGGEVGKSRQTSSLIRLNLEGACPSEGRVGVRQADRGSVRQADRYKNLSDTNQSEEPVNNSLAAFEAEFEEWWSLYPRREGSNPKHPAKLKYQNARRRLLVSHKTLVNAVTAYAAARRAEDPKYTQQAVTWLNQRQWEGFCAPTATGAPPEAADIVQTVREITAHYPGIIDSGATAEVAALIRNDVTPGVLVEAAEKYKLWVKFQQSEGFNMQPPALSTWLKFRWREMDNFAFCYRGMNNRKSVKLKKGTGE